MTSDDLVKVTVCEGKYTFGQRKDGSCYALRYGEPWRDDIFDGLNLAMAHRIEELEAKLAKVVEALGDLHHAVCGETGFAHCVRVDSGKAYPWPALDMADWQACATLAELKGEKV